MKVLAYLSHPADYHMLKHVIKNLRSKGHTVKVFARGKDILLDLLKTEGVACTVVKSKERKSSVFHGALWIIEDFIKMFYHNLRFRPDILIGNAISVCHMGYLFRKTALLIRDDDHIPELAKVSKLTLPFATNILTPLTTNMGVYHSKQTRYKGFKELSYLHPSVFKPNKEQIRKHIDLDKPYFLLRFSKLSAYHDVGKGGISDAIAHKLIDMLKQKGDVYITSEKPLSEDLEVYRIGLNPIDMHHAIAYAKMYIGDSQTMAAEAAVLGVPSLRFNDFVGKLNYLEELEHDYQLTFGIKTNELDKLYKMVETLLEDEDLTTKWIEKRKKLLREKVNVSDFWTWFIEGYPTSRKIIEENLDYQDRYIQSLN